MRNNQRKSTRGEVFTPTPLVEQMLDQIPKEKFIDTTSNFLDNSCGHGQFLAGMYRRLEAEGHSASNILSRIHGVDIMLDNVVEAGVRLHNTEFLNVEDSSEAIRKEMLHVEFKTEDGAWHKFTDQHRDMQIEAVAIRYNGVTNYNLVATNALEYHHNFDGTLQEKKQPTKTERMIKKTASKPKVKRTRKQPSTGLFDDLFV